MFPDAHRQRRIPSPSALRAVRATDQLTQRVFDVERNRDQCEQRTRADIADAEMMLQVPSGTARSGTRVGQICDKGPFLAMPTGAWRPGEVRSTIRTGPARSGMPAKAPGFTRSRSCSEDGEGDPLQQGASVRRRSATPFIGPRRRQATNAVIIQQHEAPARRGSR